MILDLGATNLITYDSIVFETYKPISSSKRITVANVTQFLQQVREVLYSMHYSLFKMFFMSLTFLPILFLLTENLNCRVVSSPHDCVFQELGSGKMIGAVEEQNGLYYLRRGCDISKGTSLFWLAHHKLHLPSLKSGSISLPPQPLIGPLINHTIFRNLSQLVIKFNWSICCLTTQQSSFG